MTGSDDTRFLALLVHRGLVSRAEAEALLPLLKGGEPLDGLLAARLGWTAAEIARLRRTNAGEIPEIPGYDVIAKLGTGGTADVFRTLDKKSGRIVALKVLKPECVRNDAIRQAFVREARLEEGIPLVDRPFAAIAATLGMSEPAVIDALRGWCEDGTLRRLGVVLRHHEFGIAANAMTVFEVAEGEADAFGRRLATQPGVTLCYRRASAPGWPYTLYCMIHGRERASVQRLIDDATRGAGLDGRPRQVLFSTRRFKQTGGRYFAGAAP